MDIIRIAPMHPQLVMDEELNKAEQFLDDLGWLRGLEC